GDCTVRLSSLLKTLGVAAALVTGACDTGQKAEPKDQYGKACSWPTRQTDQKLVWTTMAYPTGEARTSAIGVEKGVPREVFVGDQFDYTLIVTNITGAELDNVVVTEDFGENFDFKSSAPANTGKADAKSVHWVLGNLKPCESKTINVKATAT